MSSYVRWHQRAPPSVTTTLAAVAATTTSNRGSESNVCCSPSLTRMTNWLSATSTGQWEAESHTAKGPFPFAEVWLCRCRVVFRDPSHLLQGAISSYGNSRMCLVTSHRMDGLFALLATCFYHGLQLSLAREDWSPWTIGFPFCFLTAALVLAW